MANKGPEIGDIMPDGTIYGGISPDTQKPIFVAPKDADLTVSFNQAVKYAKKLRVGDKNDFRLPSKAELKLLFQNKDKGALKGTFNMSGNFPEGYYWSSRRYSETHIHALRFTDGVQNSNYKKSESSVRCIRS